MSSDSNTTVSMVGVRRIGALAVAGRDIFKFWRRLTGNGLCSVCKTCVCAFRLVTASLACSFTAWWRKLSGRAQSVANGPQPTLRLINLSNDAFFFL